MKINDKIISLPPYISTSWSHVKALHMKENNLIISLTNEEVITIPNLNLETIELIFVAHTAYLEREAQTHTHPQPNKIMHQSFIVTDPADMLKMGMNSMEGIASIMQHNPSQAHLPDLPREVIQKIGAIVKVMAPEELANFPKPEPHCNCPHCQIGKAIHGARPEEKKEEETIVEEEVKDEELKFQQWNIEQTGEKLYTVTNKLDNLEKYSVYLGEPVGCTCGKQGCEHILAVLNS